MHKGIVLHNVVGNVGGTARAVEVVKSCTTDGEGHSRERRLQPALGRGLVAWAAVLEMVKGTCGKGWLGVVQEAIDWRWW